MGGGHIVFGVVPVGVSCDCFLCAQYLMNRLAYFNQICMDIALRHDAELIKFWLDLIFKVAVVFKLPMLSQKVIVCRLSHEPLAGMLPNLHVYIIGAGSIAD